MAKQKAKIETPVTSTKAPLRDPKALQKLCLKLGFARNARLAKTAYSF